MPTTDPDYHKNYYPGHYARKRKELSDRLGGKCARCPTQEGLSCHHKSPNEPDPVDLSCFWGWRATRQEPHLHKLEMLCQLHKPNSNPRAGQLKHGAYWACFRKKCKCEACQAYRAEFYVQHNERRRVARRAAGVAERQFTGDVKLARARAKKKPVLWKDLQVEATAKQLAREVRPKPANLSIPRPNSNPAPHPSWHQAVNLKCPCDKCKKFLKDC